MLGSGTHGAEKIKALKEKSSSRDSGWGWGRGWWWYRDGGAASPHFCIPSPPPPHPPASPAWHFCPRPPGGIAGLTEPAWVLRARTQSRASLRSEKEKAKQVLTDGRVIQWEPHLSLLFRNLLNIPVYPGYF